MRQIGTLLKSTDAQRFVAYLVTQDISATAEPEGDGFAVWVRNEDQLESAKAALDRFRRDPEAALYRNALAEAARVEQAKKEHRAAAKKNVIEMRDRWKRIGGAPSLSSTPLTMALIGLSVLVGILTSAGMDKSSPTLSYLQFARGRYDPGARQLSFPVDGYAQIKQGEVWRVITPIFVHFGWLHLLFNMYWLYIFGIRIEARYGAWRMGLLVLAIAAISNVLQYEFGGHNANFGGMSGVVYGLFGFVWMKAKYFPATGLYIHPQTVMFLLVWLVLCYAGSMEQFAGWLPSLGNVANTAHSAGLGVGVVVGLAPLMWRGAT
jgi:GlpG protein